MPDREGSKRTTSERRDQRSVVFAAVEAFLKGEVQHLSFERTNSGAIVIKRHPEVKVQVVP